MFSLPFLPLRQPGEQPFFSRFFTFSRGFLAGSGTGWLFYRVQEVAESILLKCQSWLVFTLIETIAIILAIFCRGGYGFLPKFPMNK